LALLEGMTELEKRASEIDIREPMSRRQAELIRALAIRIIHGSGDRVTSHLGTLKLFDRLPNEDKEIEIYEGYEHGEQFKISVYRQSIETCWLPSHDQGEPPQL
jgi:acylglycerol lipase